MLKDRGELENKLTKWMAQNVTHTNGLTITQQWCLELSDKYNIPIGISSDIISQRKDLSEFNEFILFAATSVIKPEWVERYFTPQELALYSDKKYLVEEIKFPIKLHLIKITDEQFIGKIDAQFLMSLRQKQLINYNADTQRALRIILKGGMKILRPYIDDKAVSEIDSCYADNIFIPNMITLNINPDDEKADYTYDEKSETLSINNITAFDIVDGYHRYLGLGRNYDRDNSFNYPMMIQIATFSIGKAKQMIFQENHKTKMKEEDSSTYNQYDAGNIIVNRLNTDTESYLNGKININDGLISPSILAKIIDKLYFPKKPERKEVITATKEIKEKLNKFTEDAVEYLEKEWEPYEIIMIMYGLKNNISGLKIYKAIENISEDNKSTLNRIKDINVKTLNILKEVY